MIKFDEFIQDYSNKEIDLQNEYFQKISQQGLIAADVFPPRERFIKLNYPYTIHTTAQSIWGNIPYFGSTIIPLMPAIDEKQFDIYLNGSNLGFTSKDLSSLIDIVKDTGRIQFAIVQDPIHYRKMDFFYIFYLRCLSVDQFLSSLSQDPNKFFQSPIVLFLPKLMQCI